MRKLGLITLLLLVIALGISGCGKKDSSEPTTTNNTQQQTSIENKTNQQQEVEKDTESSTDTVLGEDEVEVTGEDQSGIPGPFLGKKISEPEINRPVLVMVENAPAARPQSGLDQASVVYEFLVEGGITRFAALYYEYFPKMVGPVRSTRPYLIETAMDYDALLLHAGASPAGFHMLATEDIDHLDELSNGKYFWRSKKRRAPHNLFTGQEQLKELLSEAEAVVKDSYFNFQHIGFTHQENSTKSSEVSIDYWGGYTVTYKFNEKTGTYLRFIEELPHLLEGGKKIYAYNIFIQYVDTKVKDDVGRLEMELTGSNKALLFKDGYVYSGYWQKDEGERTKFYSESGQEWAINPGQTWIQVVPLSTKISY